MDRLSALDYSFLTNESDAAHMHVGAILIFEGPPPRYLDLIAHIESRLHLVPRFRQKLAFPPAQTGRAFWIDDTSFNLRYHVRHSALPSPGSEEQLRNMAARVFSQRLDRTKPLWEIWLVEGLTRDRFALVSKTHHALVDGVSGVDIATVLLDLDREPAAVEPPDEWVPSPEPSPAELATRGVDAVAKLPLRAARRALRALESPRAALERAADATEALSEIAWTLADRAPKLPLNTKIGPHRRYEWVRADLGQFKRIKNVLGGTVNDVVLAVVAGALRDWLHLRGVSTDGLEVRAQVPVSIRAEDEHGHLGNKIVAVRAPLPVYVEDPTARLDVVRAAMADVKSSKQALGAEMITRFNDFAPPTLLAQAARINFSTRIFNLTVTNVPGPQIPLYMLGRRLEDCFPVGFLPPDQALFVAIMSYDGGINFGLLADFDAMPDVAEIASGIERAIAALVDAAEAREGERGANPAPAAG